jgi:ribosomal protein L7/L12
MFQPAKPAEPVKPARVDVKLVSFPDANKFKVLKEIRNLKPGMNLMEVRALC